MTIPVKYKRTNLGTDWNVNTFITTANVGRFLSSNSPSGRLISSSNFSISIQLETKLFQLSHGSHSYVACVAEVVHLLLGFNPSAPVAPVSFVPLAVAGYALPLATNVLVTVLIVLRIWYFSPAKNTQLRGTSTPSRTYMVTQIIFVVLVVVRHPAQAVIADIAVQIYGNVPTLIIIYATYGSPGICSIKRDTGVSWGSPGPIQVDYDSSRTFTDSMAQANEITMHDFRNGVDREGYKCGKMV
ncbi:hypothetical protein EDB92DRAFT_2026958 [Lactarius akahatsu]|uniref:Uncharacterized protein n=1 Tax=Lactarius akahatsu TaxID=416441 RepID=A0AAD4LBG8_9AGAM|nr:hypothetical protein EDB92DRAFT_2026958 [Lactarius akahatsu]